MSSKKLLDDFDFDILPEDFGWEIEEFLDDEIAQKISLRKVDKRYLDYEKPVFEFDFSDVHIDGFFGSNELNDSDFSDLPLFSEEDF